jgi:hypothetical protein
VGKEEGSWQLPLAAAAAFGSFVAKMVLQLAFAWRMMPETRAGTLEDVEQRLSGRT